MIVSPLFPELPFGAQIREFRIKNHGLTIGGELPNGELYSGLTDHVGFGYEGSRLQCAKKASGYLLVAGDLARAVGLDGQSLSLGGWLYKGSSGKVWWVRVPSGPQSLYPLAQPLAIDVTMSRFGAFGADPEVVTQTVTLADWGQGSGHLPVRKIWGAEALSDAAVLPFSWTPDGTECVLAVAATAAAMGYSREDLIVPYQCFGNPYAIGWLLAVMTEVAGKPTITLSVLHDRTETLGARTLHKDDYPAWTPLCQNQPIMVMDGSWTFSGSIKDQIVSVFYDGWKRRRYTLDAISSYTATATFDGGCALGDRMGDSSTQETITWKLSLDGSVASTSNMLLKTNTEYTAAANYGQAVSRLSDWEVIFNGKSWSGTVRTTQESTVMGTDVQVLQFWLEHGAVVESDQWYSTRDGAGTLDLIFPTGWYGWIYLADGMNSTTASADDYYEKSFVSLVVRATRGDCHSVGVGVELFGEFRGPFRYYSFPRIHKLDELVTPGGAVTMNYFYDAKLGRSIWDEPHWEDTYFPHFAWNPRTRQSIKTILSWMDPDVRNGHIWV